MDSSGLAPEDFELLFEGGNMEDLVEWLDAVQVLRDERLGDISWWDIRQKRSPRCARQRTDVAKDVITRRERYMLIGLLAFSPPTMLQQALDLEELAEPK